jgi:hypothetical protein
MMLHSDAGAMRINIKENFRIANSSAARTKYNEA